MEHSPDNGVDWRKELKPFLYSLGLGVFDPTDKPTTQALETLEERDYLNHLRELVNLHQDSYIERNFYLQKIHNFCKEIVSIDLRLVDLSSFLIMYVDKDIHTCGSYAEFTHARLQRKPVIVVCKQGIQNLSGFIHGLGQYEMFFNNWDEAKNYLLKVNETGSLLPSWKFFDYEKVYSNG